MDYEIVGKLGQGGFATIFLVRHRPTRMLRVAKVVRLESRTDVDIFHNEVRVMSDLDSPYVGRIVSYYIDDKPLAAPSGDVGQAVLITQYIQGSDLLDAINERIAVKQKFSNEDVYSIALHMLQPLAYLHHKGYLHRDIKPENFILVHGSDQRDLKLIDFGLVRRLGSPDSFGEMAGTSFYMAPETFSSRAKKREYSTKSDCWSVGVILVTLASGGASVIGRSTSMGQSPQARAFTSEHLQKELVKLNDQGLSQMFVGIIKGLLALDPNQRSSAPRAVRELESVVVDGGASIEPSELDELVRKIRRFDGMPLLSRLAKLMIAHETDDLPLRKAERLFRIVDAHCTGSISRADLLRAGSSEVDPKLLESANLYSADPEIPYSVFLALYLEDSQIQGDPVLLEVVFNELSDNESRITIDSLMRRRSISRQTAHKLISSCGSSRLIEGLTLVEFERCVVTPDSLLG